MTHLGLVRCPRCDRMIRTDHNRLCGHSTEHKGPVECSMTNQLVPQPGVSEYAFEVRADIVIDLAQQLKDVDTSIVYEYLTAMGALELQHLLMVALAAVPVNKSKRELFGWVMDLPVAQAVPA